MLPIGYFICFFLSLSVTFGFAQNSIKGKVQSTDGQPLPFANVLLLNVKDSSLVKGAVANDVGMYAFEQLKPNRYLITATTVGYRTTYSSPFALSNQEATQQLATLTLPALEKRLNEVTVIAKKPIFEQQIG